MTAAVAESLAKLRLVQGDSAVQLRELAPTQSQITLTVGSGPSSSWVVHADGVRPLHFSLHWDGQTLRIADTYSAGDVRVKGDVVSAQWRAIAGTGRIEFGRAVMEVEVMSAPKREDAEDARQTPSTSHSTSAPDATMAIEIVGGSSAPDATMPIQLVDRSASSDATMAIEIMGGAAAPDATVPIQLVGGSPAPDATLAIELIKPSVASQSALDRDTSPVVSEAPASATPAADASVTQPAMLVTPANGSALQAPPATRTQKSTLVGVSPIVVPGAPASSHGAAEPSESSPASMATQLSFAVAKPEGERPRKATLLGMAVTIPPASAADVTIPISATNLADKVVTKPVEKVAPREVAPRPQQGSMTGTLIGVANPVEFLKTVQQAKEALVAGAARNDAPLGAVTQNEVRAITQPPAPVQSDDRIGSTWQETPSNDRVGAAVLLNSMAQGSAFDPSTLQSDGDERYGESPNVRGSAYEPRDAGRTFPWRYVGIGVLTAAAYFAWLYLLDHF